MLINVESLALDLRRDPQTNQAPDDCTDNRAPHDGKQNRDGDRLQLLQPEGMSDNFREAILRGWIEGRGNAQSEIWIHTCIVSGLRYLSSVYFGDGVYGLRAASRHYFGREPENLTLAQSAMLAGMVQAPSRLAPTEISRSPRRAAGWCSGRWPTLARSGDAGVGRPLRRPVGDRRNVPTGTYFADWVAPQAREAFEADFGEVRVHDHARCRPAAAGGARGLARGRIGDMPRPRWWRCGPTGGSSRWSAARATGDSPFNRATQARRQPGSAFKLFVYLAALRAGWTPDSMIEDRPITIDGWSPAQQRRRLSRRDHPARGVRPVEQCGDGAAVRSRSAGRMCMRAARDLGITTRRCPTSPSLALGTAGVSLLELTSAYAAVAGGRYPIRARGLPQKERRAASAACSSRGGRLDSRRDWAPMLDLLWAAANNGTGQARRAGRADLRQDRNQPGQSRRLVHRLRRQSGGRRVGRAMTTIGRSAQGQRRHRTRRRSGATS